MLPGDIHPPFSLETARLKVQAAEDAWNTRDPEKVSLAFTPESEWRNRNEFLNISLHGLVEVEPTIRSLGATLVAITPEIPDYSAKTIKADGLTFEVLSDQGNHVAHQYRIAYKIPGQISARMKAFKVDLATRNGDTSDELPLAVTYMIDQDGTIRWAFVDADYRKRAEPADVVDALRKLKN